MAQVEDSGSGRSTNVDVNLVPFIDLMSVLITFLLITAVWTQVSMIQLGSSIYGKKPLIKLLRRLRWRIFRCVWISKTLDFD
ncbi:MAG: biopolymer transporter ExbD [Bdellovibrionales bacterium]|nr:biopolymer transporter ExbD [Bdellovibrionales bacterium]